jgi:hypothetical protein
MLSRGRAIGEGKCRTTFKAVSSSTFASLRAVIINVKLTALKLSHYLKKWH